MTITKKTEGTAAHHRPGGPPGYHHRPRAGGGAERQPGRRHRADLDLEQLLYLSSAGLRVILAAQKRMNKQGHMTVTHVCARSWRSLRSPGLWIF